MYGMTEDQAKRAADYLCMRLGVGWEPHVWENLGWCFSATLGGLSVHQNSYPGHKTTFGAFLNEAGHIGGIWAAAGDTPQEAIQNVMSAAQVDVDYKTCVVNSARDALEKSNQESWVLT